MILEEKLYIENLMNGEKTMIKVVKEDFENSVDGKKVYLYTISNDVMSFSVTNYGATITRILFPSKNGKIENIVLGYDSVNQYIKGNSGYYGVLAGRFANRIGKGCFILDGVKYQLDQNDGKNCLHGGFVGLNHRVFDIEPVTIDENLAGVKLYYLSKDGEQGMPGNLNINVWYLLDDKNQLKIKYDVNSDKKTPVSLTNHSYFNLSGDCKENILETELQIESDYVLEIDENLIPTGKLLKVENTAFDFRTGKKIGSDIEKIPLGYDHNFCLVADSENYSGKLKKVAVAYDAKSGRKLTTYTTMPGVQLYTSGSLTPHKGYQGKNYEPYDGFCLETQFYPDSPNKIEFPNSVIEANKDYSFETIYSFEIE